MRHLLAGLVLVDHACLLHHGQGVLAGTGLRTSLGAAGVAGFFVLSGALVTASWLERGSLGQFLTNRVLRIFPGYLVCLAVTALVLGPVAWALASGHQTETVSYWASQPGPLAYLLKNAGLMQFQNRIGDLFAHSHEPYSINGSLWSIPWEAGCYLMVAALGLAGALRGRGTFVLICLLLFLGNSLLAAPGSFFSMLYSAERVTVLPAQFLAGALFYLHREKIPMHGGLAAVSAAGLVVTAFWSWPVASSLFLPYLLFYAARRARGAEAFRLGGADLSYGIYIYAFPITQLLAGAGLKNWPAGLFILAVAAATVPLAGLSWFGVERPALAQKRAVGVRMERWLSAWRSPNRGRPF